MIELKITGCCADCDEIDLHLRRIGTLLRFSSIPEYDVICRHACVCGNLAREETNRIQTPEARMRPMETRKE